MSASTQATTRGGAATATEVLLGDYFDPDNPVGLEALNDCFERRVFPRAVEEAAVAGGYDRFMVPAAHGGRLADPWELFAMARVVARRSITPAIKYGSSLLAANPVWLWGSAQQCAWLAERLLGGGVACFAVSEEGTGSDLRATATTYHVDDAGALLLDGEKWPVGNAASAVAYTTLARSSRGALSLLLVDPVQGGVRPAEPAPCLGLWGHDLGGVRLTGATGQPLGPDGIGVAQVLKTLQVTRTAIAGLSLGALDSALAIAVRYAGERRLYAAPVSALPEVREELLGTALDGVLVELFAQVALRALVLRPESFAVWSCVAKVGAPRLAEEGIAACQRVLGARSFLDNPYAVRLHQIATENSIAGIFEGTSHVNLRSLLAQTAVPQRPADLEDLRPLCSLDGGQAWQPDGRALRVTSLGDNPLLALLEDRLGRCAVQDVSEAESGRLLALLDDCHSGRVSGAAGYALVWLHLLAAVQAFVEVNDGLLDQSRVRLARLAGARALQRLGVRGPAPADLPGADQVIDALHEPRTVLGLLSTER